jgi:hypothetical protein
MSANVSILGNLGRAPETRTTPEGTLVANISIASNTVRGRADVVLQDFEFAAQMPRERPRMRLKQLFRPSKRSIAK